VVTEPASGKASQSTSYAYDAFGRRLLKQAPQGPRFYQYDQAGHLLEEGSLANGSAARRRDGSAYHRRRGRHRSDWV
jgi:hypothetical protein